MVTVLGGVDVVIGKVGIGLGMVVVVWGRFGIVVRWEMVGSECVLVWVGVGR